MINKVAFTDVAEPKAMGFQEPASPIMEGIINLHHDLTFFLIIIGIFVAWMLARTLVLFDAEKNPVADKTTHHSLLEIVWTIIPGVILIFVAIPSFALLYSMEEVINPSVTIKVIGHQWYWSYEYSDYAENAEESVGFDSYMIPDEDIKIGQLRLLDVDRRIVVPAETHVRFLITAADVLHCWAVPSLGIKVDAVPGRLNQANVFIKREGVFYGQCSEICGVNHAFMPIVVEAVSLDNYVSWLANIILLSQEDDE